MILDNQILIQEVVAKIQQRYGERAVQRLSDYQPPKLQPTGMRAFDDLLGGGLTPGVMTALQGNATSGRVTLAQCILGQVQAKVSVYLDMGGMFDGESAARAGIDLERLVIAHPDAVLGNCWWRCCRCAFRSSSLTRAAPYVAPICPL